MADDLEKVHKLAAALVGAIEAGALIKGYRPCTLLGSVLLQCASVMATAGHPDCALRAIRAAAAAVIGRGVEGFVLAPGDPPPPGEAEDDAVSLGEMPAAGGVH